MEKEHKMRINGLCNSVIMVAQKFIGKVESGRARSVETYSDMQKLKVEAEMLKEFINNPHPGHSIDVNGNCNMGCC